VVQRAIAKASANYQNSSWDLVDAAKDEKFEVSKLKSEELPAEMQKMNVTERKAFIDRKAKERSELQAKIQKLTADRDQYVAQRTKEAAITDTLDTAMISAVREQGTKRNLVFK
jgi:post-segregation antitoxin (ccd killing protein)